MTPIAWIVSAVALAAYLHVWWCIWRMSSELRAAHAQLERISQALTQQTTIMSEQAAEARLANENLSEGFSRLLGAGE